MNSESFITNIKIFHSRNVSDLEIPLSENERKHLIITGKNGCGKTSLLKLLRDYFDANLTGMSYEQSIKNINRIDSEWERASELERYSLIINKEMSENIVSQFKSFGVALSFNYIYPNPIPFKHTDKFILTYFSSERNTYEIINPDSITKPKLRQQIEVNEGANRHFIQYLVNLRAQQSFAYESSDIELYNGIKSWFINFERRLQLIYNDDGLSLYFNGENLKFEIQPTNGVSFDFSTLSHGYSALISIVSELISRMESYGNNIYDLEGIVFIDEIETHLHVDLQKKVLPLLIDFFPRIQFIVTTHSPFVVSSLSNAVVCDLEKKIVTDDLSGYGYDTLIESFFGTFLVSEKLQMMLTRYDELDTNNNRNLEEEDEYKELKSYLLGLPKYLPNELSLKLRTIELSDSQKKD